MHQRTGQEPSRSTTVHRATSSVLSWPTPSHASRKGITAARVCRWHQLHVAECDGAAVPLFGSRAGLNSCVMPSLRLGEAAGEFSDVPGADQLAHSGVITWRHCPVIAGRLAAPDPPPRVLAPEPVKFGIQAPPAWAGVHGRGRPAVDAASAPPTSPGMTSPGSSERRDRNARSAMQQPPLSSDPGIPASPESGAPRVPAACCARSPGDPALATWAASRGGRSGAAARPAHKAGRVPACTAAPGMTRVRPGAKSRGPAWGVGPAREETLTRLND
jgi:hypothetical protein